ncbi:Uncharacterised protein [uncultured archaeon]|nr:Uncharacterised protein [uncultured archaeon]
MKGVYVLILRLHKETVIRVGKLGKFSFKEGYYAYVGSALGTGGFKRVTRHFDVASGKNATRKWHIDYLLPHSEVVRALLIPTDESIECSTARAVGEFCTGIEDFGCSDCSCHAHLFFSGTDLSESVATTCNKLTGIESIITGNAI